jgi:hypothetical protein
VKDALQQLKKAGKGEREITDELLDGPFRVGRKSAKFSFFGGRCIIRTIGSGLSGAVGSRYIKNNVFNVDGECRILTYTRARSDDLYDGAWEGKVGVLPTRS